MECTLQSTVLNLAPRSGRDVLHKRVGRQHECVWHDDGSCLSDIAQHTLYCVQGWAQCLTYRGGGTSSGDKLVGQTSFFSLGSKFSPRNFFCAIWGISCSLCVPSGGGSQVLLRCCRQSVHLLRPSISMRANLGLAFFFPL